MPVHVSTSPTPATSSSPDLEREVAKLRTEVETLRKQKKAGAPAHGHPDKLTMMLAALALLVSIIAMFRH